MLYVPVIFSLYLSRQSFSKDKKVSNNFIYNKIGLIQKMDV